MTEHDQRDDEQPKLEGLDGDGIFIIEDWDEMDRVLDPEAHATPPAVAPTGPSLTPLPAPASAAPAPADRPALAAAAALPLDVEPNEPSDVPTPPSPRVHEDWPEADPLPTELEDPEAQLTFPDGSFEEEPELEIENLDAAGDGGQVAPAAAPRPREPAVASANRTGGVLRHARSLPRPGLTRVVGSGTTRQRSGAMPAVAALLLFAAAVGTVVLRPDWLGLEGQKPESERVAIARPSVDLTVAAPASVLAPTEAGDAQPTGGETVVRNPAEPRPLPPLPAGEDTLPDDGVVRLDPDAPAEPSQRADLLPIGEYLQVGERLEDAEAVRLGSFGLVTGDQAFAQLHNDSFFVGNVKVQAADTLTLRVPKGEVSLATSELKSVGLMGGREYLDLMRSQPGIIRLQNNNRLVGSVTTVGGAVAVDVKSNRIVIPESEIQEISESAPAGLQVVEDADETWIRQLVEKRRQKQRQEQQQAEANRAKGEVKAPAEPRR